jgi:hypothetical protein
MKKVWISFATISLLLSCANDNGLGNLASEERISENPSSFKEIGSIVIGGKGLLK